MVTVPPNSFWVRFRFPWKQILRLAERVAKECYKHQIRVKSTSENSF
jgi:hypothetical protein